MSIDAISLAAEKTWVIIAHRKLWHAGEQATDTKVYTQHRLSIEVS